MEKHKIFFPERRGKEEGQRMTSLRENSCLKSVKNQPGEVETKEETENSSWMRHMILVEAESGMAVVEAEVMAGVELVGSFSFPRRRFWRWAVKQLCRCT